MVLKIRQVQLRKRLDNLFELVEYSAALNSCRSVRSYLTYSKCALQSLCPLTRWDVRWFHSLTAGQINFSLYRSERDETKLMAAR